MCPAFEANRPRDFTRLRATGEGRHSSRLFARFETEQKLWCEIAAAILRDEEKQLGPKRGIEWGGPITWPQVDTRAQLGGFVQSEGLPTLYGQVIGEAVDAPAMLAWMHRDAMTKAIDAEISAQSDDAAALSDGERAKRTAVLLDQILQCERQECWLIEQSDGRLEYRPDVDPRACLAIDGPALESDL